MFGKHTDVQKWGEFSHFEQYCYMTREHTQLPATAVEPMLGAVRLKRKEEDDDEHALTVVQLSACQSQYIYCSFPVPCDRDFMRHVYIF